MSSRHGHARGGFAVLILLALFATPALSEPASAEPAKSAENLVVRWNDAALHGVRVSHPGAPVVARSLAIVNTCMYDAWAAYDATAVGTRYGDDLRQPAGERTLANKREAISYAAYRALIDLFPQIRPHIASLMRDLGYDPIDATEDRVTPRGIGNTACAAVLGYRHRDGINQLGDEGTPPYRDYTGYAPVNDPMVVLGEFDPATVRDPNHWQPLVHEDTTGLLVKQHFVGVPAANTEPFALTSPSQFRSRIAPPARYGTQRYVEQAKELLAISANLTDRQKAIAEYWADGPNSEQPPGHWVLFGQYVSHRDDHTLDQDVQMFFALTNALLDAAIACWDAKVAFDYVRPITAIRYLFHDRQVTAWGGPGEGTKVIDGGSWLPYQKRTFPTPPFAEYVSGHSTFSSAGAGILRLFTGSDRFGASTTIPAGSSPVEPGLTPRQDVRLSWETFTEAADEAGISRRYGGIHFKQADLAGRALGRLVSRQVWERATGYFRGEPQP